MNKHWIFFIFFLIYAYSIDTLPQRKPINGKRLEAPLGWILKKEVHKNQPISFTILLKQSNLDKLDQLFHSINDPASSNWGKFLTQEQIASLVRPPQYVFDKFYQWLKPYSQNPSQFKIIEKSDRIEIKTVANIASEILGGISFYIFENSYSKKNIIRYLGQITVPNELHPYIDFIVGISEFIDFESTKYKLYNSNRNLLNNDIAITPSILREYYNVPSSKIATNSTNLQGIAAFVDFFSLGALDQFQQKFNVKPVTIKRFGTDCFPLCDQYESDLDVQYINAMGQGVPIYFVAQDPNYWILQFAEEIADTIKPTPLVFSISYGWSEIGQCDIAVSNCKKFNYDSKQYITRTNTALQKLGILGISVLVSDGDDGAPGLGGVPGNCPIDLNKYCPLGGCEHSKSECPEIIITNLTTQEFCIFPMGINSLSCGPMFRDSNFDSTLNDFFNQNNNCQLNLEQDRMKNYHLYSSCSCSNIQEVQSKGYSIKGYTFSPNHGPVFVADYPTSSPYVTSVGATQFLTDSNGQILNEVSCSILTGAIITTGGGFSSFQTMPSYQQGMVKKYIQNNSGNLPPSFTFNPNMRAYPDISFNGHNYQIFYSTNTNDNCPCNITGVDGTSASSPALAGLISLINDELLNRGKSPLGFLNYLLYEMANSTDSNKIFHDITEGNNNCNRAYCCQYGFSAVSGWDPVTGLGTPNFNNMLEYTLKRKLNR
jgi:subtilase family serine protease